MSCRKTKVVAGAFALLLCASSLLSLAALTSAEPYETRTTLAPLEVAVSWAASASIGDEVYVIGGSQGSIVDTPPTLAIVQIYNVTTGETTRGSLMPKGVAGAAYGLGPDGKIYIAGGWNASSASYYQKVQIYDPVLDSWTEASGSIPSPIGRSASAMAPNGTLYVFGGGWTSNVTMMYDTATNVWRYGMDQPISGHDGRAVFHSSTGIFVFGGAYGGTYNGVRIYNPEANTWSTGTSAPSLIAYASAALARNGYMYLFGGSSTGSYGDPNPVSTVLRYSLVDDDWQTAGVTLSSGRDHAVAALDQYGRVLVLGGWNGAAAVSTVNAFVMSDIAGANLIEITSPADGSIVSDTVVVNVQKVNGATNFQQIDLFVDGTLLETVIQTDTAAFLWDTSALADGSVHRLMARGYNTDGTVVEASVTVTISTLSAEQQLDDIEQQLAVLQAQLDIPGANLTALAMQAAILQAKLDGIIAGSMATNDQMNATFAGLQQQLDDFQTQIDRVENKADNAGMYSIVNLVLIIIVIILVILVMMTVRKRP